MTHRRLLVVDDEDHLRELMQACLQDLAGWETQTAASGDDCMQIVQKELFHAILLDVSMPGLDGLAVYERLQANPRSQAIPIILVTAKVLPSDRAKFAQLGVAGVISKPIEPVTFISEVSKILGWESG